MRSFQSLDRLGLGPTPSSDSIHAAALNLPAKTTPLDRLVFGVITTAAAHATPLSSDETGRAVQRYVSLLDAVGDGIQLTGAGYLAGPAGIAQGGQDTPSAHSY